MSTVARRTLQMSQAIQPDFEGDYQIDAVVPLESGEVLVRPTQRYAMYGRLNAARDNAVLVCHALSGNAEVATWWPQLFRKPGGLLDLERDCVIGINIFGSCYGSTGPQSIDPETRRRYGPTFPLINVRDIVRAQAALIESLGIRKLKLAIGRAVSGARGAGGEHRRGSSRRDGPRAEPPAAAGDYARRKVGGRVLRA